ncbi:MAG: transcription antitermination protein NusB [Flavobacteriales bacterium]|nr:MAG: transcription antitermination protein NusB [Flavobacteriales bacterium]
MVNRRYLRIKVFNALYSFHQSEGASGAKLEKELFVSIDRTFDLYVSLLLLFGELREQAERHMAERKLKRLPTASDLNPDRRFVDGPILTALANSPRLQKEAEARKVNWVGHGEWLQGLFRTIEQSELYKAHMTSPTVGFNEERAFLAAIFEEYIANGEGLHDMLEGRTIHWMEDLDMACSMLKRKLDQLRPADLEGDRVAEMEKMDPDEIEFVQVLFRRSIELNDENEALIGQRASNWESERIAVADMLLMKMALTEARELDQIPVKVTLNEYIEIAKAYSTPKSKNFINGILDSLFTEMRKDGRIVKVGRGLIEN